MIGGSDHTRGQEVLDDCETRWSPTRMRQDLVAGSTFPDFELEDHAGVRRRLSELQGTDPMIVLLARGSFCPKDHQQHRELLAIQPLMAVAYTSIVTISTDKVIDCNEFRQAVGANWPFLSDADRVVQRNLDIQEYTDPWHDPMVPYTVVLEPGLVVFRIYNGYWYWGRPTPEELRIDLRDISRRIRPDWDLLAPGLREEWDAGNKSRHWPYTERGILDLYPDLLPVNR